MVNYCHKLMRRPGIEPSFTKLDHGGCLASLDSQLIFDKVPLRGGCAGRELNPGQLRGRQLSYH